MSNQGNCQKGNQNELILEAVLENLSRVQAFIEERLEAVGCPMKTQMQISVAVEEVFINIASYAYTPNTGNAVVRAEISEAPAAIVITFLDRGIPYNPLARPDPELGLPLEERSVGGLGIYMTKKMMDEVQYEFVDGQNILTLKKYL